MWASPRSLTAWSARGAHWSTISLPVTRDRREGQARLGDLSFKVIDTAGLENAAKENLSARMQRADDCGDGAS